MAINVSFGGATIYKPGSYSKTSIDLGGGFPLSPTGLIAIFGEADAGTPGASEVNIANNVFTAEQMPLIKQKYKSGPIVDACNFLFAPGADGAIPGGAQAVYIYKTNNSTRALLDPVAAGGGTNDFGRLRAREWGIGGNHLTFKNTLVAETPAEIVSALSITFPVNISGSDQFKYSINGGTEQTITMTAGSYSNITALVAALNGAFSGVFSVSAVGTDKIKLVQVAGTNHHRNGFGRSFLIINGSVNSALQLTNFSFATAV